MFHQQLNLFEKDNRLTYRHNNSLLFLAIIIIACLFGTSNVMAADIASNAIPLKTFPVTHIFTFLFLMLGPFKIIGPFAKMTKGADVALARKIAMNATIFSSAAILTAAVIGESFLSKYGIPLPVLALTAGIILFLVALQNTLQQFSPHVTHTDTQTPTLNMAMSPLAFPTIITPYGIATLVVFLALSPDIQGKLTIGAILLVIMLLNLIAMLSARHIPPIIGIFLNILGTVLGVIQVALGLQIIHNSLRALGFL